MNELETIFGDKFKKAGDLSEFFCMSFQAASGTNW
jgi:hypothetical protein